jgi:hypothetical protein
MDERSSSACAAPEYLARLLGFGWTDSSSGPRGQRDESIGFIVGAAIEAASDH